uniref:(northern house mosquito) hypothetical protein n=1 Tax=Culex pipiens TaxID=7175 RepID=A0A8D8BDQ2_CULPI
MGRPGLRARARRCFTLWEHRRSRSTLLWRRSRCARSTKQRRWIRFVCWVVAFRPGMEPRLIRPRSSREVAAPSGDLERLDWPQQWVARLPERPGSSGWTSIRTSSKLGKSLAARSL